MIPEETPRVKEVPTGAAATTEADTNLLARLRFLSKWLSLEQMLYYKLDREGGAARVGSLLEGIHPTEDEFLGVARNLYGSDTGTMDGISGPEEAMVMQNVLSPERFALAQDLRRPEYKALLAFGRMYQLPPDTLDSLVQLRRSLSTQDATAYSQKVTALLGQPQLVARFLKDKTIHPDIAR